MWSLSRKERRKVVDPKDQQTNMAVGIINENRNFKNIFVKR